VIFQQIPSKDLFDLTDILQANELPIYRNAFRRKHVTVVNTSLSMVESLWAIYMKTGFNPSAMGNDNNV
jgi:hypothetical protein